MDDVYTELDPIDRLFFQDKAMRAQKTVEGLIFERHQKKQEQIITIQQEKAQQEPPIAPEIDDTIQTVHNNLINTMHRKKRTQLALTEFLPDDNKEASV